MASGRLAATGSDLPFQAVTNHYPLPFTSHGLSVQVNFLEWGSHRNVFCLLDRLFESSLQQFGFHLLVFGALFEEAFATLSFFLEELGSVVQVRSFGRSRGWFVEKNLAKLRIHFKSRPAAWTNHFCRFVSLLVHP